MQNISGERDKRWRKCTTKVAFKVVNSCGSSIEIELKKIKRERDRRRRRKSGEGEPLWSQEAKQ